MKRKSLWLALVAVVLVVAMGIAPAWAYFTDNSTATGAITVNVKPKTHIDETYDQGVKHVVISNDADATSAVFVRARVYASGAFESVETSGAGWTENGDWYVYDEALDPGTSANELTVAIKFPPVKTGTATEGAAVGDNYNVVVVYESTPAQYDAEGNPNPDWDFILNSGSDSNGKE